MIVVAAELPDIDFVLPLEHRGMTHSLGFAAAVGIGVGAAYLPSGIRRALMMGGVSALATSSHALLDMLTGESGTEAAWPATDDRVSLPDAPLPAMPIGGALWSRDGLLRAIGELAWATPLAIIGIWPWVLQRHGRPRYR